MQVLNTIVEENMEEKEKDEDHSSDIPTVEQLLDEVDKQTQLFNILKKARLILNQRFYLSSLS
ncbi:hypothetical protein Tco_0310741, partial [Tanacetum coccineum]